MGSVLVAVVAQYMKRKFGGRKKIYEEERTNDLFQKVENSLIC